MKDEVSKPELLLHSCCGPCSTSVIERLIDDYNVTVFFYNPNITDRDEYEKRIHAQRQVIDCVNNRTENSGTDDETADNNENCGADSKIMNKNENSDDEDTIVDKQKARVRLITCEYDPDTFFEKVKGLEDEPEGGERCSECFRLRLAKAAEVAEKEKIKYFTTTLTVSPHKNAKLIGAIGNEIADGSRSEYLEIDFKKKDGFKRSIELSKEYGLYRQNYCGCEFSKWWK